MNCLMLARSFTGYASGALAVQTQTRHSGWDRLLPLLPSSRIAVLGPCVWNEEARWLDSAQDAPIDDGRIYARQLLHAARELDLLVGLSVARNLWVAVSYMACVLFSQV